MLRPLAILCSLPLAACDGCSPSDAGPDAMSDANGPSVDGGPDAPISLITPTCHVYGIGGPNAGYGATAITVHGGRVYWSTSRDTLANMVHSIAIDFTDYRRYENQIGVTGIAGNSTGVYWGTKAADASAGLYRLASPAGTPTLAASMIGVGQIATTDTEMYFQTVSAGSANIYRAAADGTNPAYWTTVGLADQLSIKGGKLYWGQSTLHATGTACTGTAKLGVVGRAPTGATSPTAFDVALDGCSARTVGTQNVEYISRFVTDGTTVYATSHSGNVYRSDAAVGAASLVHQQLSPAASTEIVIVGTKLVFVLASGTFMVPLATAGTATASKIAEPYGLPTTADATTIYFASHQHVCKIVVP